MSEPKSEAPKVAAPEPIRSLLANLRLERPRGQGWVNVAAIVGHFEPGEVKQG